MNTVSSEKRRYELKARAAAQEATRARIAAAAASLHQEVGIARTTVADIARRAGVQRVTVYNHFPDLAALLPACSDALDGRPPAARPRAGVRARGPRGAAARGARAPVPVVPATAPMQERVLGERGSIPELDDFLAGSADPLVAGMAGALAAGFERDGARALVGVALDFWTWRRLDREGLADDDAAALMTAVVRGG